VNPSNGFWEFTGNGYAVGAGFFVSSAIDAIADTGTTIIYLPKPAVKGYYAKGWCHDQCYLRRLCVPLQCEPPETLGIGSYKAVIPGSYINDAPVSGSSKFFTVVSRKILGHERNRKLQLASVVSNLIPELDSRSSAISSSNRNSQSSTVRVHLSLGSLLSQLEKGSLLSGVDALNRHISPNRSSISRVHYTVVDEFPRAHGPA